MTAPITVPGWYRAGPKGLEYVYLWELRPWEPGEAEAVRRRWAGR